jgi:serine/threonine protein kinase
MFRPGDILEKRYLILPDPLGKGGMGKVWKATDTKVSSQSSVAIKEFEIDSNCKLEESEIKNLREQFLKESELLAGLDHESFPKVRDKGEYEGTPFIVMDFVSGEDFSNLFKRIVDDKFELDTVLNWLEQIIDSLHYLHTLHTPIIHKDIKPENLKLTSNNRIKVLDFGIAKGAIGEMTLPQYSIPFGTLHFAPLEQLIKSNKTYLSKKHPDNVKKIIEEHTCPQSDVFSLCATFYSVLAGKSPENFDALSRASFIWNEESDPLPNLYELNPKIPKLLSDLIKKGMNLEIVDRFNNTTEMKIALEAIKENELKKKVELERETIEKDLKLAFEQHIIDLNNEVAKKSQEITRLREEKRQQSSEFEKIEKESHQIVVTSVSSLEFDRVNQELQLNKKELEDIKTKVPQFKEQIIRDTMDAFGQKIIGNFSDTIISIPQDFSNSNVFNEKAKNLMGIINNEFSENITLQIEGNKSQNNMQFGDTKLALIASVLTLLMPIPLIVAAYFCWSITTFNIPVSERIFVSVIIVPLLALVIPVSSLILVFLLGKGFNLINNFSYRKVRKFVYRFIIITFIFAILGAITGNILDITVGESSLGIFKGCILGMSLGYAVFYLLVFLNLYKKDE